MSEDLQIIRRIQQGETEAFRLLIQRYQSPVLKMAYHLLADPHLSEDIAQDVFFTAFNKLASFDPNRSAFSTWLFTIARNKSINLLKKKRPISMAELPEKITTNQPDQPLIEKEGIRALDIALAKLPVKLKVALVLAELQGHSYAQIAQIEGVKIGTIKSRINRAKKKLRSALKSFEEDDV